MAMNLLLETLASSTFRVVGLDPGETTGVCAFEGPLLVHSGQIRTGTVPDNAVAVRRYLEQYQPQMVVMEDYRVYAWKTDDHTWASLFTPRLIGAIEYICHEADLPLTKQTAQMGKKFCTDDKLRSWGVYQRGQKHARDAIRHACYYLLFQVARVHKQSGG